MDARIGFSKNQRLRSGINSPHFDYHESSGKITDYANSGLSLSDFITETLKIISKYAKSRTVSIDFEEDNKHYSCLGKWSRNKIFNIEFKQIKIRGNEKFLRDFEKLKPNKHNSDDSVLISLVLGKSTFGYISLKDFNVKISEKYLESIKDLIQSFVLALAYRRTQVALRERVKELTCLYELAKIASSPYISVTEIMKKTVHLLPPAWLYPECAGGKIVLDGVSFSTPGFKKSYQKLDSEIKIKNKTRGRVEVYYSERKPELDEGPFLKEERNLINAIARELSLIVERREDQEEKQKLEAQIMHADRLATIGQLAAGVAHEINEPLANILGFAQLASKSENISEQAGKDIDKIISASMHAREVIRKLLVFSRQTIPSKEKININKIIDEGLYFFEARCLKHGIELVKIFKNDLSSITADAAQLNQVLINLVVNAVHATPEGGKITVSTYENDEGVGFTISDTGVGIKEDILDKIFLPFFTTKDVNEGTGLGLAVVHGIVSSHGGSIDVESVAGFGSTFNVFLPFNKKE